MIELNKIYCESNIETLTRMEDNIIDLTVTSPPFLDARSYDGFSWDIDTLVPLLRQKTAEGGVCVWVIGNQTKKGSETGDAFIHALKFLEHGWLLHDTMIFAKNNPMPGDCGKRYRQTFDFMFIFSKGQPKTFNPIMEPTKGVGKSFQSFRATEEGRNDTPLEGFRVVQPLRKKGNIFYYNVGTSSATDKIAFEHPAIFPEKLVEDMVQSWTDVGATVYDPFMGSGTTAKVAISLFRDYIGSETSEKYCQLSAKRLDNFLD